MDIGELLDFTVKNKASDLHLSAGQPPLFRMNGDLCPFNYPILTHEDIACMIDSTMNDLQRKNYKEQLETDYSFERTDVARFRINAFMQQRGAAAVCRVIPAVILSMDALELPPVFKQVAAFPHGLVLITGPSRFC